MNEHIIHKRLDERLEKDLILIYKKPKEGESLNSVVSRILGNKNLNLWMLSYLPKDSGIYLGESQYFDDIIVKVPYGLTVDFSNIPRTVKLFIGESVMLPDITFKMVNSVFPDYSDRYHFRGWPSADEFLTEVNNVFSDKEIGKYLKKFKLG